MEEDIKDRLTSGDIWMRALYMVFYGIAYSIAELVIVLLVIFQFLAILFSRKANERLLRLGNNVSAYIYQVFQFQTFNSEVRPFPFSDWPDDEVGENRWVEGDAADEVVESAEPVDAEPDPDPDQRI